MNPIQQIAVIGAGLMGHGIAQEFALAGYNVGLYDLDAARLEKAMVQIESNLRMFVELGLTDQSSATATPARIHPATELGQAVAGVDYVVEAVFEDLKLKQAIFQQLDQLCPTHTILASNSSTYMPSLMASATNRPDKVLVTHYFNPPHLLPLVEVVRTPATSEATIRTVYDLLVSIGKQPALVQKEVPGFIGNRMQMALLREALSLVEQGIATPQDIDIVIKNGFGRRLAVAGVFEVSELAGWDLVLAVLSNLVPHISATNEPSPLLREQVANGKFGIKSGEGFYTWTPESAAELKQRVAQALAAAQRK